MASCHTLGGIVTFYHRSEVNTAIMLMKGLWSFDANFKVHIHPLLLQAGSLLSSQDFISFLF
jgi:hypothetical protein